MRNTRKKTRREKRNDRLKGKLNWQMKMQLMTAEKMLSRKMMGTGGKSRS